MSNMLKKENNTKHLLTIYYDEELNMKMDKEFQKVAEKYNYEWIGQGTDLTTGIRDISFEKED